MGNRYFFKKTTTKCLDFLLHIDVWYHLKRGKIIMKIKEIAFTGYPVSDIKRARDFYEGVLGLSVGEFDHEIESMPGKYWIEYEIGGSTFAISNTWDPSGQSGPSIAFEVDDFEAAVAHLKKAGVNFVAERVDSPVCCFALITDPDGNSITVHKRRGSVCPWRIFARGG